MITWKIEKRKIDDLKGFKKNPRKFTEKGLKDLKKSLENLGDANIITINSDNTILGGHARIQIMKELGYKEVDVKVPDRLLNEKEVEETCIRLNANTAGEWDFDLLNDFDSSDLSDWGLDIEFPTEEQETEIAEDEVPEVKENICKKGDVWQLGNHRLMCGDSTIITDVEKLMEGNFADLFLTDPPYNVAYQGKTKDKLKILNDNFENSNEFINFLIEAFKNANTVLKEGGGILHLAR